VKVGVKSIPYDFGQGEFPPRFTDLKNAPPAKDTNRTKHKYPLVPIYFFLPFRELTFILQPRGQQDFNRQIPQRLTKSSDTPKSRLSAIFPKFSLFQGQPSSLAYLAAIIPQAASHQTYPSACPQVKRRPQNPAKSWS
jgi:hypothetical protein